VNTRGRLLALAAALVWAVNGGKSEYTSSDNIIGYIYNPVKPALFLPAEEFDPDFLVESVPVVWAESRGDPEAINPTSGTCGLLQIHPIHWRRFANRGLDFWADCTDPAANLAVAQEIWQEQGWKPWGR
jgi:hypothetical protein